MLERRMLERISYYAKILVAIVLLDFKQFETHSIDKTADIW